MLGFGCSKSWSVNLWKIWIFWKLILFFSRVQTCSFTSYNRKRTLAEMKVDSDHGAPQGTVPAPLAYPSAAVSPVLIWFSLTCQANAHISPVKTWTTSWVMSELPTSFSIASESLTISGDSNTRLVSTITVSTMWRILVSSSPCTSVLFMTSAQYQHD